jgi:hypothetical protein
MTNLTIFLCVIILLLVVVCGVLIILVKRDDGELKRAFAHTANEKRSLSASYYQALSTQLANELMNRDPQFYYNQYQRLWSKWKSLEKDEKLCKITADEIAHRKPLQEDFNIIGAWDHVSVGRALETMTNETIWDAYEDVKLIRATHAVLYNFGGNPGFEQRGEDHLYSYVKELEDTQFLITMEAAEETYSDLVHFNDVQPDPENLAINTTSYRFTKLPLSPLGGARVGVCIKALDAYGVIQYDDGRISFSKTDRSYSSVETLRGHELFAYQSTRKEVSSYINRS